MLVTRFHGKCPVVKCTSAMLHPKTLHQETFLSKRQPALPSPCAECGARNPPGCQRSHAPWKSLKALSEGPAVSSGLCWELFGFLPEFPSGRKRPDVPTGEQGSFTAPAGMGRGDQPHGQRPSRERDEVSALCSTPRSSQHFLEIQNCLFQSIKEKDLEREPRCAWLPSRVQQSL